MRVPEHHAQRRRVLDRALATCQAKLGSAQALGYLQRCGDFSLPRALATRALGALGPVSAVRAIGGLGMAAAHGKIKKKYNMENERDALFTAVDVLGRLGCPLEAFRPGRRR